VDVEVLWLGRPEKEVTWEVAHALPASLIDIYENGLKAESLVESTYSYGMIANRVIVIPSSSEKPNKKRRIEDTFFEELEGLIISILYTLVL
jgi:hypothetical protein